MFGLSGEFDTIVKPGKNEKWLEVRERWFCKTQDCKIPGKLKIGNKFEYIYNEVITFSEKETRTGSFVALSPKSYLLGDYGNFKRFKFINLARVRNELKLF